MAALRLHPTSTVAISDTVTNIVKNLDALQAVAAKITDLTTTDVTKKIVVSQTQYQKDATILARWGAGTGQTVEITAAKASISTSLPSYVTSISVADSSANIQSHLDDLQTLAGSGLLREIVQTGVPRALSITTAQLTANQTALSKFKNQAYTLAITGATVSEVLGLGSDPALATNSKIKSIAIVDTTDAIGSNLDALQRVGLRIKSITQSDPGTSMTVTGEQYQHDRLVLGKIVTSDFLAVIDASAAQAKALAADQKVVTVDILDSAKNITRNWALLQSLTDSLTSVKVSDQTTDIKLTEDQFAGSETLLSKFTDTAEQSYGLAITKVSAGTALAVANSTNVHSVEVLDDGANLVANMDSLQTIDGNSMLKSITLLSPRTPMSMDASRLQGDQLAATQGVLDTIKGGNYSLSVTGVSVSDLDDLAVNKRIVSIALSDSSDNIKSALDTLYHWGSRLKTIEQTDSGTAYDLTQSQMDSRASVLAKISGGYTVNLTGVTAARAAANARNVHVAKLAVADTGRNILARWTDLRSLGEDLESVTQTDEGGLTLSATNYQLGVHDQLIAKMGQAATFSVFGATLVQAQAIASDDAVTQIDISDTASVIADNFAALGTLLDGGKLNSIANQTPTVSLSLDATELADAQAVLDLIKGGSYTLSLQGVDVADAKDLLAGNSKIANMAVEGDGASIVANLSDLNALGKKLTTITQTDAPAETLELTAAAFEQNAAALAKIQGGFLAVLSQVGAAKAASLASNASVSSLSVSDTGANLSGAWASLADLGVKLTEVSQSDSANLQLGLNDWTHGQALRDKFAVEPTLSVSGVDVSKVEDVAADSGVVAIQVSDSASALSAALTDLAAQDKITQLVLEDPSVAMSMTGATYAGSTAILGKVKNDEYSVELSAVSADSAVALASNAHVTLMDVLDSSAEISAHFSALAAATNLNSIALTNEGGTVTLTSAQILDNSSTLDKIGSSYQLTATGVAMADLSDVQDVPQVSAILISDTSENLSTSFSDILALGDMLSAIHLTDGSPVLTLSEQDRTAGSSALALIDGSYQVDVTDTVAGNAQTVAASGTVRYVMVADTASNIAGHWDALVSLYNAGAGKLTALSLTDSNPLTLTTEQQTAGEAMIADLLAGETILTA